MKVRPSRMKVYAMELSVMKLHEHHYGNQNFAAMKYIFATFRTMIKNAAHKKLFPYFKHSSIIMGLNSMK